MRPITPTRRPDCHTVVMHYNERARTATAFLGAKRIWSWRGVRFRRFRWLREEIRWNDSAITAKHTCGILFLRASKYQLFKDGNSIAEVKMPLPFFLTRGRVMGQRVWVRHSLPCTRNLRVFRYWFSGKPYALEILALARRNTGLCDRWVLFAPKGYPLEIALFFWLQLEGLVRNPD